jgi:hypothetical protein
MKRHKLIDQVRDELATTAVQATSLPLFAPADIATGLIAELQADAPQALGTQVLQVSEPLITALALPWLGQAHWVTDPRPDLAEDSALWALLLEWAYDLDGDNPAGAFGALRAIRCLGARLVHGPRGLKIEPGEWGSEARWPAEREWLLVPHTKNIKRLLADAGAVDAPPGGNTPARRRRSVCAASVLCDLNVDCLDSRSDRLRHG